MQPMAKAGAVAAAAVVVAVVVVVAPVPTEKVVPASMAWKATIWTAMPTTISMATAKATTPVLMRMYRAHRAPASRSSISTMRHRHRRCAPSRNPLPRQPPSRVRFPRSAQSHGAAVTQLRPPRRFPIPCRHRRLRQHPLPKPPASALLRPLLLPTHQPNPRRLSQRRRLPAPRVLQRRLQNSAPRRSHSRRPLPRLRLPPLRQWHPRRHLQWLPLPGLHRRHWLLHRL